MTRIVDGSSSKVVDPASWLRQKVEALIDSGRSREAVSYLERLESGSTDDEGRLLYRSYLGFFYLVDHRVAEARQMLELAWRQGGPDAHLAYGLGHCALVEGHWWRALVHFLEALHYGRDAHDEAEFLRSAALAMQEIGLTESANAMLLGALDRDLGNPWIHDALARLYEREGKWMETLEILEALMEIVRDARKSLVIKRSPTPGQVLIHTLLGTVIGEEALRERALTINRRLRRDIDLVYGEHERKRLANTELTPMNLPAALHVLVGELSRQERSYVLLQSAQSLWARAHHERFDVMLSPFALAATIQWIVERLHFRVPTDAEYLAGRYGMDPEALRAAARIVVARFGVALLSPEPRPVGLGPSELQRLTDLQEALLTGADVDGLRVGMLGR